MEKFCHCQCKSSLCTKSRGRNCVIFNTNVPYVPNSITVPQSAEVILTQSNLKCELPTSLIHKLSGLFLQTLSALISMLRYYMGWMIANTNVYSTKIIVSAIGFTIAFLYVLVFLLYSIITPPACMCLPSSLVPTSSIAIVISLTMLVATICGILADVKMIQLLKIMKTSRQGEYSAPTLVQFFP